MKSEIITPETYDRIFQLQPCCVECGSNNKCQVHHRWFRGDMVEMKEFIQTYGFMWNESDIQNLVVLCYKCHDPERTGTGIHGGNILLREKYKLSYTDEETGKNIPFDPYEFKQKYYNHSENSTFILNSPWK